MCDSPDLIMGRGLTAEAVFNSLPCSSRSAQAPAVRRLNTDAVALHVPAYSYLLPLCIRVQLNGKGFILDYVSNGFTAIITSEAEGRASSR